MDIALIVLLIIVGIPVVGLPALFILLFIGALVEKEPVTAHKLIADQRAEAGPYMTAMMEQARSFGVNEWKHYRHVKDNELHALSLACDGRILVDILEARKLGIRKWCTTLMSAPYVGKYPVTVDELAIPDCSGLWDVKEVLHADFAELMKAHQGRLRDLELNKPFVEPNAFDALARIDKERAKRAVDLGRARWVDAAQNAWRFTVCGAVWVSASTIKSLGRMVKQGSRIEKRRPGEKPSKVPR